MGTIQTVNFRGDTLYAVENDDGCYVALKPIVESMGLNWSGQEQRVKRDPILSEGICMMHTPFGRGGGQEAICLKFDLVNGWLFTIETGRVKDEEVRKRVITYQRECFQVLSDHFRGAKHIGTDTFEDEPKESEGNKRQLFTEVRHTFGPRAAAQLYFKLGLPVVPEMYHDPAQLQMFSFSQIKSVGGAA